jgi:hypothetical protein
LVVTANVVPRSSILVALMMEGLRSFEMSVLTKATCLNLREHGILHECHSSAALVVYKNENFNRNEYNNYAAKQE